MGSFETVEIKHFRVEHYDDGCYVVDLTNAGKRGKNCRAWSIRAMDRSPDAQRDTAWRFRHALAALLLSTGGSIDELAVSYGMDVTPRERRGIDTAPAGWEPLCAATDKVAISVGWDGFHVHDRCDPYNGTTAIPSLARKAQNIKRARDWASRVNLASAIDGLSFWEVVDRMRSAGILVHTFCAVD